MSKRSVGFGSFFHFLDRKARSRRARLAWPIDSHIIISHRVQGADVKHCRRYSPRKEVQVRRDCKCAIPDLQYRSSHTLSTDPEAIDAFYSDPAAQASANASANKADKNKEKKLGEIWERFKGVYIRDDTILYLSTIRTVSPQCAA